MRKNILTLIIIIIISISFCQLPCQPQTGSMAEARAPKSRPSVPGIITLEGHCPPLGHVEGQCCGNCPSLPPIIIPGIGCVEVCTPHEDDCLPADGGMGYSDSQTTEDFTVQRKGDRLPFQIFPEPVELFVSAEGSLTCSGQMKERLPSIVVEPTDVSEVESGELRWPPEDMDFDDDEEDLFLEQCIPPANIADWGEEEDECSVIENHQQNTSLLDLKPDDYRDDTPTLPAETAPPLN
ncbi:hypothetical protein DNTS_027582 [Danionella cerebrum]|uniref:LBH domain-containing protein n=1 Tax=Danionella cerebrum TaxID=2873325 RepID=A0A553QW38_9TELE|nr:hypothetical protein DNTS_027582 [Danionella translucida]